MKRVFGVRTGPVALLGALVVLMTGAMLLAGTNPLDGFASFFAGALGGRNQIGETLVATASLLVPSLAVCLAFRAGLFNIGAAGQMLVGGLAAGVVGSSLHLPGPIGIVTLLALGAIAGGVWGGIAGILKARFGASEVISTLMLNFVASYFTLWMVTGPLKSPDANGPETAWLDTAYWLPALLPFTRLSIALLVAVAIAGTLAFVLSRTSFGFELRALGDAPEAARRSGVDVFRLTWLTLALSGAIAGVGGAMSVTGVLHRFNTQLTPGYGYIAIAVALVGDLNPLWICLAAFAFGILEAGGLAMQAGAQVPKDAISAIEGLIVIALAARRYVAQRPEIVTE